MLKALLTAVILCDLHVTHNLILSFLRSDNLIFEPHVVFLHCFELLDLLYLGIIQSGKVLTHAVLIPSYVTWSVPFLVLFQLVEELLAIHTLWFSYG